MARLTPEQIKNWRLAIPELRYATDEQIEAYRDWLQAQCDVGGTQDTNTAASAGTTEPDTEEEFLALVTLKD